MNTLVSAESTVIASSSANQTAEKVTGKSVSRQLIEAGQRKRQRQDQILNGLIGLSTVATVGILSWILWHVVSNGIGHINWSFLSSNYSKTSEVSGIWPMIVSTVYMVLLSLAIAAPIGIMAAIYLTEYAKTDSKIVRVIRFATESLAGIPSIIYGLFGLTLFVSKFQLGFSILAGALTLSILILPVIIRTTEEALMCVPNTYREGSLALGASRIYTIWRVILPSSLPGIITAIILCIGRIIGESAPVFLTAGMVARIPDSVFDSGRTLTVHLYKLTQELFSINEWNQAYATATILVLLVLSLNIVTRIISSRFKVQ